MLSRCVRFRVDATFATPMQDFDLQGPEIQIFERRIVEYWSYGYTHIYIHA